MIKPLKKKKESVVIRFLAKKELQSALETYAQERDSTVSRELRDMAKKMVGIK